MQHISDSTLPKTGDLRAALDAVHGAGMPGIFAEVRDGDEVWRGATGFADVSTQRPVSPDLRHRVGSITKTFTSAAVLQQVERGAVELDAPVARYLPRLVPAERGEAITIRMLLNHTSGLAEYLPYAYPSLRAFPNVAEVTPDSLDDLRYRSFDPLELITMGVSAPAAGKPGGTPGVYSNTNYLLLGQLLELVTGLAAEECITRNVINRAGLQHTSFPETARIEEPHALMYESFFGLIDPPRDYSDFDMSWVGPSASLVSTVADLNIFFRLLLQGKIIGPAALEEMQRTVSVVALDGHLIDYGLGLHRFSLPGCGPLWGNDGTAWGAGATSMISGDGRRQLSAAVNLMRWNVLDAEGKPQPHPLDAALPAFFRRAMGPT